MSLNLDRRYLLFLNLTAVFVTCLIVGDIIGGKLLELNIGETSFVISAGMLPFPITFLLTDLINEFYGKKAARFVTVVGFGMALLTMLILFTAVQMPWAPFTREPSWGGFSEPTFNNIFAGSMRMLFASMSAYLIAQFTDIAVFHVIKKLTGDRFLWMRSTGSTAVSQLIDTVVIQSIAWFGVLPVGKIISIVLTSYAVKLVIAIGLTPLIYAGHAMAERVFGLEPVKVVAAE
jgi:queuosine precursor transporter